MSEAESLQIFLAAGAHKRLVLDHFSGFQNPMNNTIKIMQTLGNPFRKSVVVALAAAHRTLSFTELMTEVFEKCEVTETFRRL